MRFNITRSFLKGNVTRSTLLEEEIYINDQVDEPDAGFARGSAVSSTSHLNGTALNSRKMPSEWV